MIKPSGDIWKYVATGAVSCLITMAAFVAKETKGRVTQEDLEKNMPGYVMQNSPYTQDAKDIASHLASIDRTLIVIGSRQEQQAADIASIAATAHVTARPIRNEIEKEKP